MGELSRVRVRVIVRIGPRIWVRPTRLRCLVAGVRIGLGLWLGLRVRVMVRISAGVLRVSLRVRVGSRFFRNQCP